MNIYEGVEVSNLFDPTVALSVRTRSLGIHKIGGCVAKTKIPVPAGNQILIIQSVATLLAEGIYELYYVL
jgi:hypothetical protein